ncbi:MAG TPA: glycosyltransferase family 39 protein, partial [Promineifilum sp.]
MVYEKGHTLFWTLVHGRRTPIWLFALSFVNLAVCLYLARQVSIHQAFPFDNDEVAHALPALHMLREFGQGNAPGLIRELLGQNFYPPGNSLLLLPAYAAFGASPVVARLASVVCLFLSVLVLYSIAVEIDPRRGQAAGFIAGVLTLTSRPQLMSSSLVMLEAPGLLICLLALWAYLRARRQPNDRRWLLTAFLLAAAILTKYSYGIITLAAVGANELVSLRTRQVRAQLRRRGPLLFGVLALLLAGWFLRPGQLATFFDYAQPLSGDQSWLSLNGVLYYTRSFAIHSAPSVAFALLNLAGVLWAIAHWRDGNIRLLAL